MTEGGKITKEMGIIIAVLISVLISGSAAAYPPPAILNIDGNEQTSGIGSNCWKEENQTGYICSDTIGIITPAEPLLTGSPFTAHLRFTLQEPPEEVGLSATRATDDDELKVGASGTRVWRLTGNYSKKYKLPSEHESEINLSLEPGLYVLTVDATWKNKGSASFGFLVKVYNPAAEVTTQAATATESEKPTISSPNETHNTSPSEKAAGFQFDLAITMLMAVYSFGRKRR